MKIQRILVKTVMCALLATLPLLAQAHTALKTSVPADGATVRLAPASMQLEFNAPVRLIKLELLSLGEAVETRFTPATAAIASYNIETPDLKAGTFTVNWSAMGADGHIVSNSFSFVIDPSAAPSTPTSAP